jgi:hypothetical protein
MPLSRLAACAIALSIGGFVALESAAMRVYPGGTWWNVTAVGHSFWQNYLCDLTQPVAIDHVPNPLGSMLGRTAMLVLVAGLFPFWAAVPLLFVGPRLARLVRMLGFVSMIGVVGVVLLPSSRFGQLHGILVVLAGVPGLSAAVLTVAGLLQALPQFRLAAWLGVAMLLFALVDFTAYTGHLIAGGLGTPILPALQKVALLLLIAWMLSVSIALTRAQARPR